MANLATQNDSQLRGPLIAPIWHTVVTVILLLAMSLSGARARNVAPISMKYGHMRGYLVVIAIEWSLVAFTWYGLRLRGVRLAEVVGKLGIGFVNILRDVGIGIAFLLCSNIILSILGRLIGVV